MPREGTTGLHRYAVDIDVPIGTPILAVADGVVTAIGESFMDTDHTEGHENFVLVKHGDGTAALYGHLTYLGAAVEPGEVVAQGGLIGYSGNTGNSSGPHLHFNVLANCSVDPPVDLAVVDQCVTVPMSFRNASPASSCGLRFGVAYTAQPY